MFYFSCAKLAKSADLTKTFAAKTDETPPFLLIMSKIVDKNVKISKKSANFAHGKP